MATLKNTTINDSKFLVIPAGDYSQRPPSPSTGAFRYNTFSGYFEYFNGTVWKTIFR